MERVLYNLHHKCCTVALYRTSRRSRVWAEHFLLVVAVCGFGALSLLHLTFVHRDQGLMTIDSSNTPTISQNIPATCLSSIPGFDKQASVTHLVVLNDDNPDDGNSDHRRRNSRVVRRPGAKYGNDPTCSSNNGTETLPFCSASASFENDIHLNVYFSFSREKGYLLLSSQLGEQHGIDAQYVLVSRRDVNCFGEPFLQKLSRQLVGTDTIMINWLVGAFASSDKEQTGGFIYNPRTHVVIDLGPFQIQSPSNPSTSSTSSLEQEADYFPFRTTPRLLQKSRRLATKAMIIVKTSFLFFITTTLVSRTLHETQSRMLDFTHSLAEHVRTNRPVGPLVATHVVENLVFVPIMVGMIFFLIEFYRGDKLLAFMVLSLVFVCESFSVVRYAHWLGVFQNFQYSHYPHKSILFC